ncbi:hypothetical protein NE237_021273 [Protea cynaroides]|uniref:Uncharacterized protein n=1 Tax=Protea cynaroides TaxID=273540 RepID=A0A9Q0H872_9MAGN|nr:hypothetical protein NE237_021273 [Protea cynaroides]
MGVSTLSRFSEKVKLAINVGTWHHGCAPGPCDIAACGMGLAGLCCLRLWLLVAWALLAFVACGYGCWPALGHGHMAIAAGPCGMPCDTMLPCGTICHILFPPSLLTPPCGTMCHHLTPPCGTMCHLITFSLFHIITFSLYHIITFSLCHIITFSFFIVGWLFANNYNM